MNKKKIILIFGGVLAVFLFGFIVFTFNKELIVVDDKKNNVVTTTINKKDSEEIATTTYEKIEENYEDLRIYQDASVRSWKIYYDELYKIEFQYPLDWEVETIENIIIGGGNHDLIISNEKTVLFIKLQKDISDRSFNEDNKNNIIKNIITNNHVSFAASRSDGLRRYFYSYFFKIEDEAYRVFYHAIDLDYSIDVTDVSDGEKKIVNNIINTIKFK